MRTHILIVDDNAINAKLAHFVLELHGYDVQTASDARSALDAIERKRPALILMDLQLPDVDGLSLTRRLKGDQATREIVIVAVTAYAMKGDSEKAYAAGCDGYVTKPIDPEQLPYTVHACLNKPFEGEQQ